MEGIGPKKTGVWEVSDPENIFHLVDMGCFMMGYFPRQWPFPLMLVDHPELIIFHLLDICMENAMQA